MKATPKHMKISELSARAKTPVTTIRFYLRKGLLPFPIKTAKTMAYYTQEHLKRLIEIRRLKEENQFTLEAIQDILGNGDDQQNPNGELGPKMTQTRDEIIKATVRLFREKGYDRVTIADIAAAARVGKSTFYQYFKNKEELFWACVDAVFEDIGRDIPDLQTETDGLERLWIRGQHFIPFAGNLIELLSLSRSGKFILGQEAKARAERALTNFIEPVREELERIVRQHHLSMKNSLLLAYLLMGAVEYSYYYILNYHRTFEEITEAFWKNFFGRLPSGREAKE